MSEEKILALYEAAQEARRKADKMHKDAIAGDADNLRDEAKELDEAAFTAERAYLAEMFKALKSAKATKWMKEEK